MISLSKELFLQIVKHCKEELPDEACGILAGKGSAVEKAYEMINADKSPENFIMDPAEQLKVMKELRNLGLEMVGIYHSHVASEAYPSSRDIELAFYPEARYCIVTLKDKNNPRIRAFRIKEGKISEEEISIK
ncbi:M67 family peptidase [bacterium]|nr:MAG: M67 family peptidase [bacterium]